jgi:hypothetical protein
MLGRASRMATSSTGAIEPPSRDAPVVASGDSSPVPVSKFLKFQRSAQPHRAQSASAAPMATIRFARLTTSCARNVPRLR